MPRQPLSPFGGTPLRDLWLAQAPGLRQALIQPCFDLHKHSVGWQGAVIRNLPLRHRVGAAEIFVLERPLKTGAQERALSIVADLLFGLQLQQHVLNQIFLITHCDACTGKVCRCKDHILS